MAQKVFRFRNAEPGVDILQLRSEINDPLATIDAAAGGQFVDVLADETVEDDLIEVMASRGYVFVEADPELAPGAVFVCDVVNDILVDDVTLEPLADDVTATLLVNA